jgi:8-oxo-dGTP diphosphatase
MAQNLKLSTLCYLRDGDKTLMLNRNKKQGDVHTGKWNGLGGKFERGESPEECVKREVKEESGLLIHSPKLRGFLTFPQFKDGEDWYVYVFEAYDFEGKLIDSPEGELEWIKTSEVPKLPLWAGDLIFMKWIEQQRFFSAKFVYDNKQLISHSVEFLD